MRSQGLSFRQAVEQLKGDVSKPTPAAQRGSARATIPVAFDAEDQALLQQVIDSYQETLKAFPEALAYLKARGLDHPEVIDRFKLGYANRTLSESLVIKGEQGGSELRGRLTKLGIYRDSGHEHFSGSLVVPVLDEIGQVQEVYGRRIRDDLRKGTPAHLYLPGPHRGVWNVEGLRSTKEIILCEALIDALTFWCAGFRNVTAAYGVEGFTQDHLDAFERYGIERVLIAYDRDEAGDRAAVKLAHKLMGKGIACHRIQFPKGLDANAYALKVQPAWKALQLLILTAEWMGSGPDPQREAAKEGKATEVLAQVQTMTPSEPILSLAAAPKALPKQPAPAEELAHEIQGQDLLLALENRRYRVRGWQKPANSETLKVNLMVARGEAFHVDTLDLYQAKARAGFVRQAGLELSVSEDKLKLDLGKVLRKVEALQGAQLAEALAAKAPRPAMSEQEHAEALGLLQSPELFQRILADFAALGIVGEEPNKLTCYLAAVSRLLDRPLALMIQSASAAGKSSLMDAVLDLLPEEDLVRYSAMSGQSLFYMGDRSLQHKILAIAEEEGARQAGYALKLLQSEGRVTMASTGKDPASGMLVTHDYTVEGPVMLMLTTTAIDLDEELLNRCLVLTVNESREQTRAIHGVQRSRETLEGLLAKTSRDSLLTLHRNAQRLLQPMAVVNPYADQLRFRDDQTRSRRDHVKYLTLIRSIALLHQFQREVKTVTHEGQELRYLEVIPEDIQLANELAQEVLGRTVDELLPQTRKLLTLLQGWVKGECAGKNQEPSAFHFTRRQAREAVGWGDTQLWIHLDRLVELEYLEACRGKQGRAFQYELLALDEDAGNRGRLLGLIDTTQLQSRTTTASIRGEEAEHSAPIRPAFGGDSAPFRGVPSAKEINQDAALRSRTGSGTGNRSTYPLAAPVLSYPKAEAH
jgi:DNA primase